MVLSRHLLSEIFGRFDCTWVDIFIVNIGLGLFNLIPIPPLDGSKILGELSCKVNAFYWKYQRYWRLVMILCVVTGALSKPLGLLNEQLIRLLWQIIKAILFI